MENKNHTIEIERTPGFSADGGASDVTYSSANAAFNAYLSANGMKRTPENKAMFKKWLDKAKASGKLEAVLKGKKNAAKEEAPKVEVVEVVEEGVNKSNADGDDSTAKKTKTINMKTMLVVGGIVTAIALISWGVYAYNKRKKAKG